jgi:virulence factor Mce-like protein
MNKAAPSLARILTMVVFALSCFGLLLFLWLSFGGPIPLKPKGYNVHVQFPEATTLAQEADVRVAGVSVGKVRKLELGDNFTTATLELEEKYAPLREDAQAMLRQKTLLGETYVELTMGRSRETIPENGTLARSRVIETVQLDEIFDALDPETQAAFRGWQQDLAKGIEGRGSDFNDALGTLPGWAADGEDVLAVLDTQRAALGRLVKNTGVTFAALTANEAQLENLITSSKRVFDATAARNDALAETIRIFPTFLDESRATLARLETFSADTEPLLEDLQPVARDLQPTLRDVRALAPDLENFFLRLDELIEVADEGMPAAREILREVQPVLDELHPFLAELNPIFQYLEFTQIQVSDFISMGGAALADTTSSASGGTGHYLRQFGPTGAESIAIHRERLEANRGNTYVGPMGTWLPDGGRYMIAPQWDCSHTGGEQDPDHSPPQTEPGCFEAPQYTFQGKPEMFTRVDDEPYTEGD